MKKFALFLSLLSIFVLFLAVPKLRKNSDVSAWFGACTPGWPAMTNGLCGEIALPQYKFSPDFYTVGNTVTINTRGFNKSTSPITDHFWLVVNKVIEAPKGTNISDGQPTTPGLNENQLNDFHKANNDVQQNVAKIDIGSQTFPASGSATFGGSYTTNQPGYYQFDFLDIDPNGPYSDGHILSAGFFRVLAPVVTPTPSPSPSPSTKPTPSPTPSPSPCVGEACPANPTPTQSAPPSPTPTPDIATNPPPRPTPT